MLGMGYFLCAWLGRWLAGDGIMVSDWLPAGWLLSTLLLNETRRWPWLMLAVIPPNLLFEWLREKQSNLLILPGLCAASLIQAGAGAWLVRRWVAERPRLRSLQEFVGLIFFAGALSSAVGAMLGMAVMQAGGLTYSWGSHWKIWWGENVMAVLACTPLLLAFGDPARKWPAKVLAFRRLLEGGVLLGGMGLFFWYVLALGNGINSPKAPALIFVLWAGLRFGLRGGALAVFLLALWMTFLTTHYLRGLSSQAIVTGSYLFTLQIYVVMAALVGIIPAIVLEERDRTLAELLESKERFRILTEAAVEGVFISEHGRVLDVSDQGVRMLHGRREDIIGKDLPELVSPGSRAVIEAAVRQEREGVIEHEVMRLDGTTFLAEARARMVEADGRRLRMTALRDVTERKRVEQSLRESEEKFSKAFRASPDGLAISELETGRYLEVNEGYCQLFGFPRDEMLGQTSVGLGLWIDLADRERLVASLRQEGQVRGLEARMRSRQGEVRSIAISAETIEFQQKPCLVSVLHDVTDRQLAEETNQAQRKVLEMIACGRSMQETMATMLRLMEAQFPELLGSVLLVEAGRLQHCAAPSLPAAYCQAVDGLAIGPCVGSCGTAAYRGQPVFVADIAEDPLWADYRQLALSHGLRACWSTPIFDTQRKVLGTFAVYRRQPGLPDERHQEMISMVTHTAAICISRHQAEREREQAVLREQHARIEYTLQLIAAQEAERKRIAAELHDSMGQNLLLIKNLAHLAQQPAMAMAVPEQIATINHLAGLCIAEARRISRDLHPHQLDHLGLKRSLEAMLEHAAQASTIRFVSRFESVDDLFAGDAAMNLYRIVQESVNNILKHSQASQVDIRLERDVHEVTLLVQDDGAGFAVEKAGEKRGLGLKNITERVRMLHGQLKLDSQPGGGTRLEVTIPIYDNKA